MRFTPAFLDEIRARLPVSQVVARKVQLKRKGREFAGLSPFKDEKTPSFFVNDHKGFYHCFASGEHGDIFRFVMETEGLPFPEVVERLAGEAGVPMPAQQERTPQMMQRDSERERLYKLLETACEFFQGQLQAGAGREARSYLDRRGLQPQTIATFRIGYAPSSKSALKSFLKSKGFNETEMALSGMAIHGPDIRVPYDRFRDRVIFPITDLKGRVIAFGGRALDANVPAKYLNSPETPLFHKGTVLYNAANAREPAYKCEQIIIVEGYMDVVALYEAGFANAVAPLGTALTQEQIALLWRLSPEPLLCFDGDSAGRKAAHRAVETALPHLQAGKSLSFAFLPDGLDPDDLLRQEGPDALSTVLAQSRPLSDVLWEREWADGRWQTPERRAALEQQIFALLEKIADENVRKHYHRAMRDKLFQAWRHKPSKQQNRQGGQQGRGASRSPQQWRPQQFGASNTNGKRGNGFDRFNQPPQATSSLRQSRLVSKATCELPSREALLLRVLLNHPWLIDDHCEAIAALEFTSNALADLRNGVLNAHAQHNMLDEDDNPLDRTTLRTHLTISGLDFIVSRAERALTHKSDRFADPDADRPEVELGWLHAVALHGKQLGLIRALDAARRTWEQDGSEEAQARLFEIKELLLYQNEGHEASTESVELAGDAYAPAATPDPKPELV